MSIDINKIRKSANIIGEDDIGSIEVLSNQDKKDTYPAVSTHSSSSIFVHGPTAISLHPDTNVYPPARDTQRRWQLAHLLLLDILPPALRSEYCTVVLLSVVVESFRAR